MKDILQDMKCKLISIQKKKVQQADFYIFANNYLSIHIWNPPTVLHISRINLITFVVILILNTSLRFMLNLEPHTSTIFLLVLPYLAMAGIVRLVNLTPSGRQVEHQHC